MINLWKKLRAFLQFLQSRAFAVSMMSLVLAVAVFKISSMSNVICVVDENGPELTHTMESRPEVLAQTLGLGTLAADEAVFSGLSGHYGQFDMTKTFQASVTVDGTTRNCVVESGTTVGKLLYDMGISYDGNDLLSLAAEKPVEDGDAIVLQRVEYEEYTVDEEIPYETVRKNSSLIRVGSSRRIQEGENGSKTLTYIRRTVNGVREDVQLLGEQITKRPVTETILIGSVAPISDLDFDLNVDENGRPVDYVRLLTNQVATGYSARPGAKTASGRYAVPGHVAVNPAEIPYGSKLYIVSTDNKFVYGCAIAADTGTGLMADIVDVDLFYETYAESVLNGRRMVDIYILE